MLIISLKDEWDKIDAYEYEDTVEMLYKQKEIR